MTTDHRTIPYHIVKLTLGYFKQQLTDEQMTNSMHRSKIRMALKNTIHFIGLVILDQYFQGQEVFAQNQWRVFLNNKSEQNKVRVFTH